MGHRLSKIYTRTGDKGTTGLGDGSRIDKDDVRVEAYGTVDELNSAVGVVAATEPLPDNLQAHLLEIQHDLFDLGGELCIPGHKVMQASHVERLEQQIEIMNRKLPMLKEFILPGGNIAAAQCHMARAICRRAERRVYTLANSQDTNEYALVYLNRLSDWLFVAARTLARTDGGQEVLWNRER